MNIYGLVDCLRFDFFELYITLTYEYLFNEKKVKILK